MKKPKIEEDPFKWLTPEKAARLTKPIIFNKDYSFEATRQEWPCNGFIKIKNK